MSTLTFDALRRSTLPAAWRRTAWAAALLLGAGAAVATPAAAPQPLAIAIDDVGMEVALAELGSARVVKGAPYCADALHETVQTLADGNRIVRRQQSRLCRDGEGRTRQELDRGGRQVVWLRDPVARQVWLLDPAQKTARRLGDGMHGHWFNESALPAQDAEAWRAFAERAREQARAAAEQGRAAAGQGRGAAEQARVAAAQARTQGSAAPVVITRQGTDGKATEIHVLRLGDGAALPTPPAPPAPPVHMPPGAAPVPPVPPVPPLVQWQAQQWAPRGPGVVSALGNKDIDGVRAQGERTTWTIEAGKIGNEKPIQITREVWTAPDLQLTLMSRDMDPRRGEALYRLAQLKRGEPEAALMKVPSDYRVLGMPRAPAAPAAPRAPKG
ncbi:MAG: hypothetical protein HY856_05370 [Burkholderiales bacterium]|nr:hypothetical protein [Burkholderiales bacterium]